MQQQVGLQQPLRCAAPRFLSPRSNALAQFYQSLQQPWPPSSSLGRSQQQPHHSSQQPALQQRLPAPSRRTSLVRTSAAAGDSSTPSSLSAQLEALAASADVLYRFTRPHTMLGTFVSIVSVSIMAMQSFTWTAPAVSGLLQALVPALLMNVAIVGINQLYDVEIDKVNKPYLPLASGELSMQQGSFIVVACAVLSLGLGLMSGSPALLATLAGSLLLGVLYSIELPFMRWKRSPWLAALCILAVRAVMVQLGFFLHMQHALGLSGFVLSRPLAFTMAFMLLYSVVIALFKDLPDIKGDTQAGVRTFSVRHGAKAVYWTCIGLLLAAYAGGVLFAATSPVGWTRLPVALGHMALAGLLWSKSVKVNPDRKQVLAEHYMFIWKLFYAEYLIIPFLR